MARRPTRRVMIAALCAAPAARFDARAVDPFDIPLADGGFARLGGVLPARAAAPAEDAGAYDAAASEMLAAGGFLASGVDFSHRWGRATGAGAEAARAALLTAGLAIAEPGGWEEGAAARLQLERAARKARRGLWAERAFAPAPARDAWPRIGFYAIVRGRPVETAVISRRRYLNFDDDYRRDFTAVVERENARAFAETDFDAAIGADVEVRGWVELWNGPLIRLRSPLQLRTLGA